ncbi:hypothetical protein WICPIJ_003127 [Wickerhamomyces pijperi]|uniref:Uncharacterized protein n=1 Tax=Wickerhamomyces pijperi TaxID=599730 RepID=A0A9P8Q8G7_WICPI|nr:hypothetical protein WICPIJ_003127 [Wickerhamomyces pijperi]
MTQEKNLIAEKTSLNSNESQRSTTITTTEQEDNQEPSPQYSDDLFPNFKSLKISTPTPQHELLSHLDKYQSLQTQLQTQLSSTFIQFTKFKIQTNPIISVENNKHNANKIINIPNSNSHSDELNLESTESQFKPLSQVMGFPTFQLRQTVKGFEDALKDMVNVINERSRLMVVMEDLEKRKKSQRKSNKKKKDEKDDVKEEEN